MFIGWRPQLKVDNQLNMLTHTFDKKLNIEQLFAQMIAKMELIIDLHKVVLGNNEQAHIQ